MYQEGLRKFCSRLSICFMALGMGIVLAPELSVCAAESVEEQLTILGEEAESYETDREYDVSAMTSENTGNEEDNAKDEEAELAAEEVHRDRYYENAWYYENGWYYYSDSGEKLAGWYLIDGKWYYMDPTNEGIMLCGCKKEIGGNIYFFNESGEMQVGWVAEKEGWYYVGESGAMQTGWQEIDGYRYFLDSKNEEYPGLMLKSCKRIIDGKEYTFTASGAMRTGWEFVSDKGWKYYNRSGDQVTGWQQDDGKWYFLDPANEGIMLCGCKKEIGGKTYFFNKSGEMQTGWAAEKEGWYYAGESGAMQTGWQEIDGYWYFLDSKNKEYPGLMLKSCKRVIDGKEYTFTASGAMRTGWEFVSDKGWKYYNRSGDQVTGWQQDDGKWYFLDPANEGIMMYDRKKKIEGKTYFFNESGAMQTGWAAEKEGWYYYDRSGHQVTGWQQVDGKWYYMDPSNEGIMVFDSWKEIGGDWYFLNEDGSMVQKWLHKNGVWYYMDTDGAMRTDWQYIDGYWYYFYKAGDPGSTGSGTMAVSTTIDGCAISINGQWDQAYQYAYDVLNAIGWDLWNAYSWTSTAITYYTMTADASPGSCWFATYGFENRKGNCYVMSAIFYYLAKTLGYDAHQISGYVPTVSGSLTPHSWVEIDMDGATYVFDPDFTNGTGRNAYQITYGTSGTWRYSNYYRMN